MSDKSDSIRALLEEREGYVRTGKADRVKEVDAELRRLGYDDDKKTTPAARKSTSSQQSTAD